ncbi:hypothetical protein Tco_1313007 [Tanacetum coccineum]
MLRHQIIPESDPERGSKGGSSLDYPADRDEDEEEEEEEHQASSPTHIEIPESCLPLRKRVRFASPTPSREVGESSAAGAARQEPSMRCTCPSIGLFMSFRINDMRKRVAKMAHELWGLSMILRLCTVTRRQRVISALLTSDHRDQVQLIRLEVAKGLQTQFGRVSEQHGYAEGPSQPDCTRMRLGCQFLGFGFVVSYDYAAM